MSAWTLVELYPIFVGCVLGIICVAVLDVIFTWRHR